jgi:UDP-glucuronate 4-epimerase
MNILVTGAAGFIGSHTCEALLAAGHEVTGLDNFDSFYSPSVKVMNLAICRDHKSFLLIRGDLLDGEKIDELLSSRSYDLVIHLAARAGVRPSILDPLLYARNNVDATVVLLEAMRRHGVSKCLLASSSSVYGNNPKVPFSEGDNVDRPISPYAATKKACEELAYTYHHLFGLNVFCLRFFTVYGPRQRPEMAIHKFIREIDEGSPVTLFGDGSSSRDYTFITDIVSGILTAAERVSGYEIINLGGSSTISLLELLRLIERSMGKEARIVWRENQQGDVERTWADVTKAKTLLGFEPTVSVEAGVRRFVDWYMNEHKVSIVPR